jgi:hypothetical protein
MNRPGFEVGQYVRNMDAFYASSSIPTGTLGRVIECFPGEVCVEFPGKRVRAPYSAFEPSN